jgi:hypothetical protein
MMRIPAGSAYKPPDNRYVVSILWRNRGFIVIAPSLRYALISSGRVASPAMCLTAPSTAAPPTRAVTVPRLPNWKWPECRDGFVWDNHVKNDSFNDSFVQWNLIQCSEMIREISSFILFMKLWSIHLTNTPKLTPFPPWTYLGMTMSCSWEPQYSWVTSSISTHPPMIGHTGMTSRGGIEFRREGCD